MKQKDDELGRQKGGQDLPYKHWNNWFRKRGDDVTDSYV
jgi:hypothetical protein